MSANSSVSLRTMTGEQLRTHYATRCNFAEAGTYGHECGKPASLAAVMKSDETKSGIYFARRCPECAKIKGGENSRVIRFETFNADTHKNVWK